MQKTLSSRKYVSLTPDGCWYGNFYLDYYIVKSEIKIPGSDIKATVYGIEIEKKLNDDGTERLLEHASIKDIFASIENTRTLINRLSQRLVTPSAVEYVIDDMLGEKGFEPPEVIFASLT